MIAGFARVEIAALDPASEASAWAAFLGQNGTGGEFRLANIALRVRAPQTDEQPGLARLVFAVDDLSRAAAQLARRGAGGALEAGELRLFPQVLGGAALGLAPAPSPDAPPGGPEAVFALDHVVIRTADAERAIAPYGARLGLDFRLDRSNPAWGSRLLFFRCGDAVVEIAAPIDGSRSDRPDALGGLAFRARDPDAVRARLAGAGFDVSEVRPGRKPGTRVFTLRAGLACAPALVIGASPAAD